MNLDLDREVTAVNRSSRPVDMGSVAVGWPYAVFKSGNGFDELTLYFIPSQLNKLFH